PDELRFYKAAKRRLDDISTVAAAFSLTFDADSRVRSARLAYGGVAAIPTRCTEAETALTGRPWNQSAVAAAASVVAATLHPLTDHRGSAAYRLALAQSLLEKFHYQSSEVPA
ncbi:MAG TPA: xanthine dehydrogenase small subunit, partial [Dongiaceae bacterium]